jgi:hypothetical protein
MRYAGLSLLTLCCIGGISCQQQRAPEASPAPSHVQPTPGSDAVIRIRARLSPRDIIAIEQAVMGKTSDAIISIIEDESAHEIGVRTGVERGPLEGGGAIYVLVQADGVWTVIRKEVLVKVIE